MAEENLVVRTLEYHCVEGGVCHCDWRLTLQNCAEGNAMKVVYILNIAISAFVFVIGVGLLFHRMVIKGHRLFDTGNAKGCLRPKPIDCMLSLLMVYNILRLVTSVILVTDVAKNMISRSFMFEFPWQFGYGAFALYLVGIAQTLADSHKAISNGWLPSPRTVDVIGSTFFVAPFVVNNIAALIAGAYAERDLYVAEIFTRILYVLWFIHCGSLALAVLFSGIRLVRILNRHLSKFQSAGPRYESVKTGIYKIRAVMGIIVICLMMFAVFLLLYGALRDQIMVNVPGSIFLGVIWNFLGPLTTLFVEMAIIFNPKIGNGPGLGLKSSSNGDKTASKEETQTSSSYTGAAVDMSFQGTMSVQALEDLKQQQIQYQQVFQKHNNRHGNNNNNYHSISTNVGNDNPSAGLPQIPLDDFTHYNNRIPQPPVPTKSKTSVWRTSMENSYTRLEDPQDDLDSQIQLVHNGP